MSKIAIVILNWNGVHFLERFLPKVIETSKNQTEIIVIDNASTDSSIEFMQQEHPDIRLILNEKNFGFAGGYNTGLKQIDAEYYIILNSDIEVGESWISPIITFMDKHHEVAACQPKILSYNEPKLFEYAGAGGGFIDSYGYPFCRGRIFQHLEEDNKQYDQKQEVFWASGACLFIRAKEFHDVGGFDEDYFAHMEEIDLCWRLKQKGKQIYCIPESKVYHVGGGTLPNNSAFKTYLNMRNNLCMVYKNLPKNQLFKIILSRLVLDGIAAIKFFFSGGISNFIAVFKAHFYFYKNLNKLNNKRKKIHHKNVSMIFQGNIVLEHFVKRRNTFPQLEKERFSK